MHRVVVVELGESLLERALQEAAGVGEIDIGE
jgi:hypothetical protein